jgi:3-oxoacyl-[acyl-carrier-protein] synthase II
MSPNPSVAKPRRRVVITGLGPVTAFGLGIQCLWDAMLAGRSAVGPIRAFDATGFPCHVAAEMLAEGFSIRDVVPKSYRKATKVMCRDIELAVAAASAAVKDAGLITKAAETDPPTPPTINPDRFGCHIGAGLIAADLEELTAALATSKRPDGSFDLGHWGSTGMTNLTPLWLLKYLPNMLACHVTIVHDCRGPSNTITCCEASALLSLGESMRVIERGAADACLTGGAETKVNPMAMFRQAAAGRLARTNNGAPPASHVRPFDADAAGTVLGEGGGILVLESEDIAKQRGARVIAEITGYAATQSRCADKLSLEPDPSGEATAAAISQAIRQAGLTTEAIDAIAPLGCGLPTTDAAEANAIRAVFGKRAVEVPLITTVPNVGNCTAGNAAVSLCVAAKALMEGMLPARLNTVRAPGLNAEACAAKPAKLRNVLVFTTSQGGQNAAVVLSRHN